jgi:tetratricopeptide (TPR) repeat protein
MPSSSRDPAENHRIESWKEIAAFFGRDERTVRRWEKTRNLPVHRLPGEYGGVFAYTHELRSWLNSPKAELVSASDLQIPQEEVQSRLETQPPAPIPVESAVPTEIKTRPQARRLLPWILAGAAVIALSAIVPFQVSRRQSRSAAVASQGVKAPALSESPAHELYLEGRYYWTHRTEGSMKQAVDAFSQAVLKDPQYAPAFAGLADSYNLMPEYGSMPSSQAYPLAIVAARRAIALDDSLSEAHRSLAFALFYWQWDVNDAFREFERAIQLDPKDVEAHSWYATSLLLAGHLPAARAQIAEARELNPASRAILADEAVIRYSSGDRAAGLAELKQLEETESDFVAPPRYLATFYFQERNYPAYVSELKRAAAISKNPDETSLAQIAQQGWEKGGEHNLLEQLRTFYRSQFDRGVSSGFDEANICALMGRKVEADQYLQAAFDSHDFRVMTALDDRFSSQMRGDPLFEKLENEIRERMHQSPAATPEHGG